MPDELDPLVDQIAARVRARLGAALPLARLAEQPCEEDPASCSSCGHCVARRPEAALAVANEGAARLGAGPDTGPVDASLAGMIDHTLLKPDATAEDCASCATRRGAFTSPRCASTPARWRARACTSPARA
jgi:ferredoxin